MPRAPKPPKPALSKPDLRLILSALSEAESACQERVSRWQRVAQEAGSPAELAKVLKAKWVEVDRQARRYDELRMRVMEMVGE